MASAITKAEVRGSFGYVFCDFSPEFIVVNVDGENPHRSSPTGEIAQGVEL